MAKILHRGKNKIAEPNAFTRARTGRIGLYARERIGMKKDSLSAATFRNDTTPRQTVTGRGCGDAPVCNQKKEGIVEKA